jgi:hypothetical protein
VADACIAPVERSAVAAHVSAVHDPDSDVLDAVNGAANDRLDVAAPAACAPVIVAAITATTAATAFHHLLDLVMVRTMRLTSRRGHRGATLNFRAERPTGLNSPATRSSEGRSTRAIPVYHLPHRVRTRTRAP